MLRKKTQEHKSTGGPNEKKNENHHQYGDGCG
jgi:hypothetical protein